MSEQVEGIRGQFRRFTPSEVGVIVRIWRETRGMKRAVLAHEAHVSDKTVERIEAGKAVAEGTFRRLARALGLKEELFVQPVYIPAPEEAVQMAKRQAEESRLQEEEFKKEHSSVPVKRIHDARDVMKLFGKCAFLCDDSQVAESDLELVAEFKDALTDWGDIADEISAAERLRAARSLFDQLPQIERLGYIAKGGVTNKYRLKDGSAWELAVITFFKQPRGTKATTPDEVWLPKKMKAAG